uniref:Beta-1,3-galactosyltransferase bre-5-like n=1 Tax=Phallusia mammillata TaxID=59560 RepID=A0A6F9D6Q9_9ASCI|nr:beta-1,3-galactosyltransferase bre-5-like [Phallusia mammillata]
MYCGFMFEKNSGVIRGNGKLSVQPEQYPESIYPDFCRGVMVIMTYEMLIDIYMASTVTNYQSFPLEDVMVYGILRQKISTKRRNIQPVINRGLPLVFYPWDETEQLFGKMKDKWQKYAQELHSSYLVRHKTYNRLKCFSFDIKMPALMLELKQGQVF